MQRARQMLEAGTQVAQAGYAPSGTPIPPTSARHSSGISGFGPELAGRRRGVTPRSATAASRWRHPPAALAVIRSAPSPLRARAAEEFLRLHFIEARERCAGIRAPAALRVVELLGRHGGAQDSFTRQ